MGATIARQCFDRDGGDVLIQVGTTVVVLAVNTGAPSSVLNGLQCSPNLVHGPLDTGAMAHSSSRT